MNEEALNKLAQAPETQTELSFVVDGQSGEILIEFAEGVRKIPDHVVQIVGGIEKLQEIAPVLKEVKYEDFLKEFNHEIERQKLNDIGRQFIGNHFGRRF